MIISNLEYEYSDHLGQNLTCIIQDLNRTFKLVIDKIEDQLLIKKQFESGCKFDENSEFFNIIKKHIILIETHKKDLDNWGVAGSGFIFPPEEFKTEIIKSFGIPEELLKPKEKLTRKVIL